MAERSGGWLGEGTTKSDGDSRSDGGGGVKSKIYKTNQGPQFGFNLLQTYFIS